MKVHENYNFRRSSSRKRHLSSSAIDDEYQQSLPLSTVIDDDPYETKRALQTYSNSSTSGRHGTSSAHSRSYHHFDFVNPKPGKLYINLHSVYTRKHGLHEARMKQT